MRVGFLAQGALLKLPVYEKMLRKYRVTDQEVAAIGDDLMELPMLRRAGLAIAVQNAVPEVKDAAHYVTQRSGGRGAVREAIEVILKSKGLWEQVVRRYL
jgi:3-deoxy-D-manno-octulosonate 8-phosphate phosphatase (KDO 8-P phosphatase)